MNGHYRTLTSSAVARRANCHKNTVLNYVRRGTVSPITLGDGTGVFDDDLRLFASWSRRHAARGRRLDDPGVVGVGRTWQIADPRFLPGATVRGAVQDPVSSSPPHLRELADRQRRAPEAHPGAHGAFVHQRHDGRLWAPHARGRGRGRRSARGARVLRAPWGTLPTVARCPGVACAARLPARYVAIAIVVAAPRPALEKCAPLLFKLIRYRRGRKLLFQLTNARRPSV